VQLASSAIIATERPTHHLKRLCEHFARERGRHGAPGVEVRFDEYEGYVDFAPIVCGSCRLNARNDGLLVLSATGADQEALAAVQRILSDHVEHLGRRERLSADWGPATEVASPD
jgi:hypothetical protein